MMNEFDKQTLLTNENKDNYILYKNNLNKNRNYTFGIAVSAIVVAIIAISIAISAHTKSNTTYQKQTELQSQVSNVAMSTKRNYKTEFSGLMLMNQPVCTQSRYGYLGCLDLINTANTLLYDLVNLNITKDEIVRKIKNGDYNIGNSVVYGSNSDDTFEATHPALDLVFKDSSIHLTINDMADISKCNYVWNNIACLNIIEIGRNEDCNVENSTTCAIKVIPVIHILDYVNSEHFDGMVKRSDKIFLIWSIAGGIPDRRLLDTNDKRRGIGGPCYSGLGERLLCHCRSSGCGYLEYYRDPSCRWGC